MKVLVTGGSGFIGGALIRALLLEGFQVRALVRKSSALEHLKDLNVEYVQGDLKDEASLDEAVKGVDYIFHLAGVVAAKNLQEFMNFNSEGCARLGRAVVKNNPQLKRFVYVSSAAAVGPSPSKDLVTELACIPNPISCYGKSKLQGELKLAEILGQIPLSILRPPPVYGPRDKGVFQFFKILNSGIYPVLRGNNESRDKFFSMIYVDDLVAMIIAAATKSGLALREDFFAVGDEIYSWTQIMDEASKSLGLKKIIRLRVPMTALAVGAVAGSVMGKLLNRNFPFNWDKFQEMKPDYYVYSNVKAKEKLGFQEKFPLSHGIKQTIDWYKANRWL